MINQTVTVLKNSDGTTFGTAAKTSVAIDVSKFGEKTVHVWGTFVATVQVMLSASISQTAPPIADSSWVNKGSAFTAPGQLHILERCNWVQLVINPYTSGTVSAALVGDKSHESGGRAVSG